MVKVMFTYAATFWGGRKHHCAISYALKPQRMLILQRKFNSPSFKLAFLIRLLTIVKLAARS